MQILSWASPLLFDCWLKCCGQWKFKRVNSDDSGTRPWPRFSAAGWQTLVAAWPRASEEEGRSRPTVDTMTSQLGAERTDGKYDEATISSVTPQRLCVCVLAVLLCLKWWNRTQWSVRLAALGEWPVQPSSHSLKSRARRNAPAFLRSRGAVPAASGPFSARSARARGMGCAPGVRLAARLAGLGHFCFCCSFCFSYRFCPSVCGRGLATQDRI